MINDYITDEISLKVVDILNTYNLCPSCQGELDFGYVSKFTNSYSLLEEKKCPHCQLQLISTKHTVN